MYDALRMNDNFDIVHVNVKKPVRFQHLKTLVNESRTVHRYLFTHTPTRMI